MSKMNFKQEFRALLLRSFVSRSS